MSANRQRIERSIRALALTREERRQLLGEGQNKGGKPGSAGVGTSEAEESRMCCDGSTSGSANPGATERDPDSDGAGQDGLDPNDPANLSSGDGTLSGVVDCETGAPVCFDGSGFIPPDGWDSPNEPPIIDGWAEGIYWRGRLSSGSNVIIEEQDFYSCEQYFTLAEDFCPNIKDRISCGSSFNTTMTCDGIGQTSIAGFIIEQDCASSPEKDVCTGDPPTEDGWPEDGCTNLAIVGGKIVGSKYDPENDGSYSAPRDSIDLCDPENGARITLRASGQSDWKTIDAVNGGDGYLYSGGQQIARVSGDEFTDPNV